jgi:DNA-binding winged helix-turn-helix (wHTH) protein
LDRDGSGVTNQGARRIQFGVFEADLSTGELRRGGVRVRLQSQPFKLLAVLAEHPGEVVSREALQIELWGAGTNVDFDHSLSIAVNRLREALGDSADNPRFIETLARRGYRFIAPVTTIGPQTNSTPMADSSVTPSPVMEPLPMPSSTPRAFLPWLAAGLVLVCLILSILLLLR